LGEEKEKQVKMFIWKRGVKKPQIKLKQFREREEGVGVRRKDGAIGIN
jgi:ribosomal protein L31E